MRITINLHKAAKAGTGIAIAVLIAGQWALITGPLQAIRDQGAAAAAQHQYLEFFGLMALQILALAGLPLITGGIVLCVLVAYEAYRRTHIFASAKIELTKK